MHHVCRAGVEYVAFEHVLLRGLADAARVAELAVEQQAIGRAVFHIDVVERRFRVGARTEDLVDDRILVIVARRAQVRKHGRGQRAVGHRIRSRHFARTAVDDVSSPEHPVAVVVRRLHVRIESAEVDGQVRHRLDFDVEQSALAFAYLLEKRRADQKRIGHVREIRMRSGERAGRRDLSVSQDLLAVAAQMPLLVEALQHDAHRAGFVLPVDESAELRIGLAWQVRVYRLQ